MLFLNWIFLSLLPAAVANRKKYKKIRQTEGGYFLNL